MKNTYVKITKEEMTHTDVTCGYRETCSYRVVEVGRAENSPHGFTKMDNTYEFIKTTHLPLYAIDYIDSISCDYASFIIVDNCFCKTTSKDLADIKSFDGNEYYTVAFSILNMLYHTHGAVFVDLRIIGDTSETNIGFNEREWILNNYVKVMCDKRFKLMPAIFDNNYNTNSLLIAMLDEQHTKMLNEYIRLYNAE